MKCFACGSLIWDDRWGYLVGCADEQDVSVGHECYKKIRKAGWHGYQPPKGGPRLYILEIANAMRSRVLGTDRVPADKAVRLVCSDKLRSSTQKTGKGNEWWRREPFHVRGVEGKTRCGIKCDEWLDLEPRLIDDVKSDPHCCQRCNKLLEVKV